MQELSTFLLGRNSVKISIYCLLYRQTHLFFAGVVAHCNRWTFFGGKETPPWPSGWTLTIQAECYWNHEGSAEVQDLLPGSRDSKTWWSGIFFLKIKSRLWNLFFIFNYFTLGTSQKSCIFWRLTMKQVMHSYFCRYWGNHFCPSKNRINCIKAWRAKPENQISQKLSAWSNMKSLRDAFIKIC